MQRDPVVERFLRYVRVETRSVMPGPEGRTRKPSSEGQEQLAAMIQEELRRFGVPSASIQKFDDGSFVVTLPAIHGFEGAPHVAFAAHLDTYPLVPGAAEPIVHEYAGGDIALPNAGVIIPAADLRGLEGQHIITASGGTLLGGDDKAGVASLVTVIERIITGSIPHGQLTFWFCVDEEIGELDVRVLPAELVRSWDILWTVDGERVGDIDIGCFVCRLVHVTFTGADAHPGVAGKKIKPAHYGAAALVAALAQRPTPMVTGGLDPFYYVAKMEGNASRATVLCAPRSFDREESGRMLEAVRTEAELAAGRFGLTVTVEDRFVCGNTRSAIAAKRSLLDPGLTAHRGEGGGREPELRDVRGGTDGAMIDEVYQDLPAPNMGIGVRNLHGPQEFVVLEELERVPHIIMGMVAQYGAVRKGDAS